MFSKQGHSTAKGVTTKIKKIRGLMSSENNITEVNKKVSELQEMFRWFPQTIHKTFHSCLHNRESIEESQLDFELIPDQIEQLRENVNLWQNGIKPAR